MVRSAFIASPRLRSTSLSTSLLAPRSTIEHAFGCSQSTKKVKNSSPTCETSNRPQLRDGGADTHAHALSRRSATQTCTRCRSGLSTQVNDSFQEPTGSPLQTGLTRSQAPIHQRHP
eukprot:1182125-Pleurochrysis_carterae.AAC.1